MTGVQKENTADAGGGQNVGWIDNGDWMDYAINMSAAGTYTVSVRLASQMNGAQFQFRNSSGAVLATVAVPNTGGWQTWQTVTASMTLPAGSQTLRIVSTSSASWNINWFEFASGTTTPVTPTPAPSTPTTVKVEAETYTSMSGVGTETTADTGGGQNVGWIDRNDWMDYSVTVA